MVLPGKNPLPAKVRIKRHETKGEEFYNVDQWKWYTDVMPSKDYADPVQIQVRKLLNRAMVHTFALFEFKHVMNLSTNSCLSYQCCMMTALIELSRSVKAGQSVCLLEMNLEIVVLEKTDPDSVAKAEEGHCR